MTDKQLHRLKKRWLAEGYRKGLKYGRLDETAALGALAYAEKNGSQETKDTIFKWKKRLAKLASVITFVDDEDVVWLANAVRNLVKKTGIKLGGGGRMIPIMKEINSIVNGEEDDIEELLATAQDKAAISKKIFTQILYRIIQKLDQEERKDLGATEFKYLDMMLARIKGYVHVSDTDIQKLIDQF